MRVVQSSQMQIGEVDISQIKFDPKSRDDIPQILKGLQHLYVNLPLREKIFELLEAEISPKVDKRNGRPGMTLWTIFVCGVLRLDLNQDYERLHDLVNHHSAIRQMLGHGAFNEETYHFQAIKDNVGLLTPALLDKINLIVVNAGHILVKKKDGEALRGRCDSFVVETDVHYPTDINLLYDAMRKVVTLTAQLCESTGSDGWRQHAYNVNHLKRRMRSAQSKKRSKARSKAQQEKNAALIIEAHREYLDTAGVYLSKAQAVEQAEGFVKARRAHAAVESAINALEVHGLDRCPDHGIDGFKRYVALAVVARNIHRIGAILTQQQQLREQRKKKYSDRDCTFKLAA